MKRQWIDTEQNIQDCVENMEACATAREELIIALKERHPEISNEMAAAKEQRLVLQDGVKSIDEKIVFLTIQLEEAEPEILDEINKLRAEKAKSEKQIKLLAYDIDPLCLGRAQRVSGERYNITVSKVSTSVSYKTDDLLSAMPHLRDYSRDGDNLVRDEIDQAVLDRLIASGEILESDIEPFRIVVKDRNPSVRITEKENE